MRSPPGSSLLPARDTALRILDELCQDLLEVPLVHVDSMTPGELAEHDVSAKFKWLRDLIVKEIR
jgi:hypothetical protein